MAPALGALALLLAVAPSALASTVQVSNANRISVNDEGSERNSVAIAYDAVAALYTVSDGAGVDALGVCAEVDATTATCPGASIVAVTVRTGAAADSIFLDPASMPRTVEGSLDGGTARDTIAGAGADDALIGGSDADWLDGGEGADDLRGGGGRDLASYGTRSAGVVVTVGAGDENDGNLSDASGSARDTVRADVEQVLGSAAADALSGDGSDETLLGGEGDDAIAGGRGGDSILGGGGADSLFGDAGRDAINGELGGDRLRGGDQGDRLIGGPDDDILKGQRGVDSMRGKSGIDRIIARDGVRDSSINCGSGANSREKVKRDRGKRRKRSNDPKARRC